MSLGALSDTIDALHAAGYPPVFILMYDQAWLLCERLFPLMEALMGPEVALDTSIFAWSLRRATPLRTTSTTRKASSEAHSSKESTATHAIGDNFGVPHRDSRYSDCHTVEGQPTEISYWLPLVDVTPDSGCMLVVPAQHDPLFAASNHPLHMKPTEAMPWAHIRGARMCTYFAVTVGCVAEYLSSRLPSITRHRLRDRAGKSLARAGNAWNKSRKMHACN